MGTGGFQLVAETTTTIAADVNIFSTDYELPEDTPDDLVMFVHLSISLSVIGKVEVTRNGGTDWYPIKNEQDLLGNQFESIPIMKGDLLNVRSTATQTTLLARLMLEE